jgi:hypothetical protein
MSLTLRNELLTGAEHGKAELLNHSLIGFSFRIGSQGERLTEAFNFSMSSIRRPFTDEDNIT